MRIVDPIKSEELLKGILTEIKVLRDSGHNDHDIVMSLGMIFMDEGVKEMGLREFIVSMNMLLTARLSKVEDKSIKL
tara:strand:- start:2557 stop:2787 length:231 start_codon:yes stop_codon:yes gene_type:complete